MNVIHKVNVIHESATQDRHGRREARVETMLDAARGLLAREGLAAVTVQRVAQSLGYVPAAMYRYYPSKDALVAALQRRTIGEVHAALTARRAQWAERSSRWAEPAGEGALLEALGAVWFYLGLERSMPEQYAVIAVLLGDPRNVLTDEEAQRAAPPLMGLLGDVRDALDRAVRAGALERGDASQRAFALWACAQGSTSLAKLARIAPGLVDVHAVGAFAAASMLRAWGADERSLRKVEAVLRDEASGESADVKNEPAGSAPAAVAKKRAPKGAKKG